jgi:hypothetical protein
MFLRKQPHTPTVNEFILKAIKSAGLVDVLTELGII